MGAKRIKYLCPLCCRMQYENEVAVCRECASEHYRLHRTYREIIVQFPSLQAASMPEIFERLWKHYKERSS